MARLATAVGGFDTFALSGFMNLNNNGLGNQFFVDGDNGNDGFDGTSPETAKATIASAVSAAAAGSTIYVKARKITALATDPVSYAETITIPNTKPGMSIIGIPNSRVQGGLPQMKIGAGSTAMITVKAPGFTLMNMGVNGASSTGGGVLFVDDSGSTAVAFGWRIENCHFKNCTGATASAASGGAVQWAATGSAWQGLIQNCRFYKNNGGIVLKGTSDTVPQDIQIQDCYFSSAANTDVDCDIYLAAGSGVSGLNIRNCSFGTVDVPAGAGGGIARYLSLTNCKGMIAGCRFACNGKTFGAAGNGALIPTTVRIVESYQEPNAGSSGEIGRT